MSECDHCNQDGAIDMLICEHIFHRRCLDELVGESIETNTPFRCPICGASPDRERIDGTEWVLGTEESSGRNYPTLVHSKGEYGCIGPYPWAGQSDYSHHYTRSDDDRPAILAFHLEVDYQPGATAPFDGSNLRVVRSTYDGVSSVGRYWVFYTWGERYALRGTGDRIFDVVELKDHLRAVETSTAEILLHSP